jgi:hypothetical protein
MGRPINSKYFFNNDNTPFPGFNIDTITVGGNTAGYSNSNTAVVVTFTGGTHLAEYVTPVAVGTSNAAGYVTSISVTTKGQGWLTAPTATLSNSTSSSTLTTATVNLTQDSTYDGASAPKLALSAYIPVANGGASAKAADILKQESSRRYHVQTADGKGTVRLTAPGYIGWSSGITAGYATLTATDSAGGTYYVVKLSGQRAIVVQNSGTQIASDTAVKWTLTGSATAATSTSLAVVKISSN